MTPKTSKTYLGDGVYADYDGMHIVLTTDRDGHTDTIYLDDLTVAAFLDYLKRVTTTTPEST